MRGAHPLRQPNPLIGRRGWHPNVGDQNRRSMRFDEFDRGVVILGGTDDGYVGVHRQRPGDAVPQQQRILCDDDRNSITHVAVVPPLSIMITDHDACRKPSVLSFRIISPAEPSWTASLVL